MPDTRKWAWNHGEDRHDRPVRELSPEEQVVCLEIDLALVREAYEAKLAGYPSVNELPIYADK